MKKKQFMSKLAALTMAAAMGLTAAPSTVFAQTVTVDASDASATVTNGDGTATARKDDIAKELKTEAAGLTVDATIDAATIRATVKGNASGTDAQKAIAADSTKITNVKNVSADVVTFDVTFADGSVYTVTANNAESLETGSVKANLDLTKDKTANPVSVSLKDTLDDYFKTAKFSTYDGKKVNASTVQAGVDAFQLSTYDGSDAETKKDLKTAFNLTGIVVNTATVADGRVTGSLTVTDASGSYTYEYSAEATENVGDVESTISAAVAKVAAEKTYPSVSEQNNELEAQIAEDINAELGDAGSVSASDFNASPIVKAAKAGTDGTYTTTINGVAATFKLVYGSTDLIADATDAYGDFAGKGTAVTSDSNLNLYLGDDQNNKPASETAAGDDNNTIVRFEDTSDFSRSIQARTATVAAKEDAVVKAVQDAAQKAFTDAYKDENVTWKAEIADKKFYLLDSASTDWSSKAKSTSAEATKNDGGTYVVKVTASTPNSYKGWKKAPTGQDNEKDNVETSFYVIVETGKLGKVSAKTFSLANQNVVQKKDYTYNATKVDSSKAVTADLITINPTLTPDDANEDITYTVYKEDGKTVATDAFIWKAGAAESLVKTDDSKATQIATDSQKGLLVVLKPGTYVVKAQTATSNLKAETKITVTANFADVNTNAYYADPVLWGYNKGIVAGVGNGNFDGSTDVTRAQYITFLYRTAVAENSKNEIKDADVKQVYSDVPTTAYYAKAVQWAAQNTVAFGTGDDKFSPNATVTRAQAVTFIYRMQGSPDTGATGSTTDATAQFTDIPDNAYYRAAVTWAVNTDRISPSAVVTGKDAGGKDITRAYSDTSARVVSGTSTTTFSPDASTNRAQAITFIDRAFHF